MKMEVPSYEGKSLFVRKGQELVITDIEGKQVGDFVCFNYHDLGEYVSPAHMRASLGSIRLKEGDFLHSNRRRPLMQLVEDTVGKHDFFFPACDYYRYKVDYDKEDHPNCYNNLKLALKGYDIEPAVVPDPINWFMNIEVKEDGSYSLEEPISRPGDYVRLKALEDVVIALAVCSQDLNPVNGFRVTPLQMEVR